MEVIKLQTYKYTVDWDNSTMFIDGVGNFPLNPGDNPKDKAEQLVSMTQKVDVDAFEVEEVDNIDSVDVVTSDDTINK